MTECVADEAYDLPHGVEYVTEIQGQNIINEGLPDDFESWPAEQMRDYFEWLEKKENDEEAAEAVNDWQVYRAQFEGSRWCERCDRAIPPHGVERHKRYHRYQDAHSFRAYRCRYCYEMFATLSSVTRHTLTQHTALGLVCNKCGERFFSRREMLSHFYDQHARVRPCCRHPDCEENGEPRTFADFASVNRHIVEQHSGKKPKRVRAPTFACKWCDAMFVHESSYVAHLASHAGKILCRECEEPIERDKMQEHVVEKHADDLTCTECDPPRRFTRRDNLLRHRKARKHKIFVCRICDPPVFFKRTPARERHMKRHQAN